MKGNQSDGRSRQLLPVLVAVGLVLLHGCGAVEPHPVAGLHLVAKAHDFMNVAAVLLSQSPPMYSQGLRSLYYGALTLARIKDIRAFSEATEKFHARVWGMSPLPIRKYFGGTLKAVRVRHDYQADPNSEEVARDDFDSFVRDGLQPFAQLVDQAADSIRRDFRNCHGKPQACHYCGDVGSTSCLREQGIRRLEQIRAKLEEVVVRNHGAASAVQPGVEG